MDKADIEVRIEFLAVRTARTEQRLESAEQTIHELRQHLSVLDALVNEQAKAIERLTQNEPPMLPIV